jgi:hypothetical protein
VRLRAIAVLAALALPSLADQRTQRLLERLAEEASAFEQNAPNLISEETLRQRAETLRKRRFHPHIETGAPPPGPVWQNREIVSEYTFASVGDPPVIREIRRVLTVDGKTVNTSERAVRDLLRSLQASDDKSRKKLLEDFEKHGLIGTVTDFGQILLLFARRNQETFEFAEQGERLLGAQRCLVFAYHQHEGPGVLTIWDSKQRVQPRADGEIWVDRENFRLVRITIKSVRGTGENAVREEAQVDYDMGSHGVVVPTSVEHREYRNGRLTAENLFSYAAFRKFGASAEIKFTELGP